MMSFKSLVLRMVALTLSSSAVPATSANFTFLATSGAEAIAAMMLNSVASSL
jgi:hypothetical protein